MRRRALAVVAAALAVVAAAYLFVIRDEKVAPGLAPLAATAVIGSGDDAVGVAADGRILVGLPAPEPGTVPSLPLDEIPEDGRLRGPVLAQAKVLGAAPEALRTHIERSYLGDSGIDVMLRAGIEVRFGDASNASLKWKAAAAVLADPATSEPGYVNVQSPHHPSFGDGGPLLPSVP